MRWRFAAGMAAVAASAVLISGASGTETRAQAGTGAAASGGIWGTAEEVPGVVALNQGGNAEIVSISCGSAGNCSGGGYYKDASGTDQAFVVTEINGTWGSAEQVPGMATLAPNGNAEVSSVSCARTGDCDAAGDYTDDAGLSQVFVVSEKKASGSPHRRFPALPHSIKGARQG